MGFWFDRGIFYELLQLLVDHWLKVILGFVVSVDYRFGFFHSVYNLLLDLFNGAKLPPQLRVNIVRFIKQLRHFPHLFIVLLRSQQSQPPLPGGRFQ